MHRHWNTTIKRSKVFWSVKSRHPIATTWSNSPSRYWRSNQVQWHHRRVQGEEVRRCFAMLLEDWIPTLGKGGGAKKRLQYCVNPHSSSQLLYFRAIQGHSRSTINPALQDNVLYQVRNGIELRSTVKHVLIVGGDSEPDGRRIWHVGNSMRSHETKDRAIQEYLETPSKYSI